MNTQHPLLPPELNSLAADMAQFSGISEDASALFVHLAYGAAAGNTIRVRTGEWRDIAAPFNLALISTGAPTPRGALMPLLGSIPELVKLANDQMKDAGMAIEALKVSLEQLKYELREIDETLPKDEVALAYSITIEAHTARAMAACHAGDFSSDSTSAIAARVTGARQRREEILCAIDTLIFKLHHGILVDEPDWRELPKLAEKSFDESVLAMCFAKGPADIFNLSAKDRADCALTLNRHRIKARAVTVITCGPESAYADLLSRKPIRESGILSGFLFMDVAKKAGASPRLLQETQALAKWHELITKHWERRIALQNRECDLYHTDAKGFAAIVDFRKWVEREQGYSPEIASHLSFLADMPLRLALTRASMSNAEGDLVIPHEYIEQAVDFLRRIGRRHRELLDRFTAEDPKEEVIEQQLGRVVARLESRGALTLRGLARCFHHQDYGRLEPLIDLGVSRGKIRKDGNLFSAPPVSVSASA